MLLLCKFWWKKNGNILSYLPPTNYVKISFISNFFDKETKNLKLWLFNLFSTKLSPTTQKNMFCVDFVFRLSPLLLFYLIKPYLSVLYCINI